MKNTNGSGIKPLHVTYSIWVFLCVLVSWTSIPKVAGLIPTVVRLTFQPVRCGYTLRVT